MNARDEELVEGMEKLVAALAEAESLLAFHEGSAKPEHEGAHPTIRVNGEDWATLTAKVRAALAAAGAA